MHETSLVRSLMAQVGHLVAANGGGVVRQVRVQVGPLACVEPALVTSAWNQLRGEAALDGAALEIEEVPLVAHCRTCKIEFEPVRFCFRCPRCGGTQTEAVSGDGVMLDSIVLDDAEEGAAV
ncbi:MAG: hydrogenase maturation nickel metallochaperone HypA [Pirellulales bacterium]